MGRDHPHCPDSGRCLCTSNTAYQPNPAVVCGKGILLSTGQVVYTPCGPGSVGQPIILAVPNGAGWVPSGTSAISGKGYREQVQREILNR
jgi:hypothetical protein